MNAPRRNWDLFAWAGLIAAPAAWALHHQAGSDLNFANCLAGHGAVLISIGAASMILVLAGGGLSFLAWRGASEASRRFIAALGLMACGLFALTILLQIAAAAILPACFR